METTTMNYIKPICLSIIALGAISLIYCRIRKKVITYREIETWAKSVCGNGDICHISILSNMPDEIKANVRRQNGARQILNGYKDESSIFVTVTDNNGNIKNTCYFMGKSLDNELKMALSSAIEHRIIF